MGFSSVTVTLHLKHFLKFIKTYLLLVYETSKSEEKEYKIYHCEGDYECQKIQDSYISRPMGKWFRKIPIHILNASIVSFRIEYFDSKFASSVRWDGTVQEKSE